MKKLYLLIIIFAGLLLSSNQLSAQCTPDPDCTDPQGDGEYCPTEFPNAVEDEFYSQTLTVIAPVEQGGFTLHHIDVLSIENIPPGMNYQCQNDDCSFYPASPKCISISGTPEIGSWGEYNLHLTIEIFIDVAGNAISIGTFTDSSTVVFIEPQVRGTFEINAAESGILCSGETYLVSYTGNAGESATYNWEFGDNATVLSGTGQGPYEIVYNGDYLGMDSISLFVEEGVYTSPTFIEDYEVSICDGVISAINSDVNIYPNPFDGKIEIKGFYQDGTIKIYDLTAKEIFSAKFNNSENQFDLSELQSSVYLVSVITNNEVTTQKIVKR